MSASRLLPPAATEQEGPAVRIHLPDVLQKGDAYRVVNVLDFYGPPVAQGEAQGPWFVLPMGRHRYEPEFGAYLLFRSRD